MMQACLPRSWVFLSAVLALATAACQRGGAGAPRSSTERAATARRPEIDWISLPAGTFQMGSVDYEDGLYLEEKPRHEVSVPAFQMARTEVTVGQYRACVDAGVCTAPSTRDGNCNWAEPGREQHPVNCVDWMQASTFSRWVGGRLPSESEWEYACRAGTETPHFGGSSESDVERVGWCSRERFEGTKRVGQKDANSFGLHDVYGNVWEWCEDYWHDNYTGAPADGTAWMSLAAGKHHVVRGGGWYSTAGGCRSAYRYHWRTYFRRGDIGFRPARSLPKPPVQGEPGGEPGSGPDI